MQARPLRLSTAQADFETLFQQRLHWSAETDEGIEQRVADILADVRQRLENDWRSDAIRNAQDAHLQQLLDSYAVEIKRPS